MPLALLTQFVLAKWDITSFSLCFVYWMSSENLIFFPTFVLVKWSISNQWLPTWFRNFSAFVCKLSTPQFSSLLLSLLQLPYLWFHLFYYFTLWLVFKLYLFLQFVALSPLFCKYLPTNTLGFLSLTVHYTFIYISQLLPLFFLSSMFHSNISIYSPLHNRNTTKVFLQHQATLHNSCFKFLSFFFFFTFLCFIYFFVLILMLLFMKWWHIL